MRIGSPLMEPIETLRKAVIALSHQRDECQRAIRVASERITKLDKQLEGFGLTIDLLIESDKTTDHRR